jgi:hypothetical protein
MDVIGCVSFGPLQPAPRRHEHGGTPDRPGRGEHDGNPAHSRGVGRAGGKHDQHPAQGARVALDVAGRAVRPALPRSALPPARRAPRTRGALSGGVGHREIAIAHLLLVTPGVQIHVMSLAHGGACPQNQNDPRSVEPSEPFFFQRAVESPTPARPPPAAPAPAGAEAPRCAAGGFIGRWLPLGAASGERVAEFGSAAAAPPHDALVLQEGDQVAVAAVRPGEFLGSVRGLSGWLPLPERLIAASGDDSPQPIAQFHVGEREFKVRPAPSLRRAAAPRAHSRPLCKSPSCGGGARRGATPAGARRPRRAPRSGGPSQPAPAPSPRTEQCACVCVCVCVCARAPRDVVRKRTEFMGAPRANSARLRGAPSRRRALTQRPGSRGRWRLAPLRRAPRAARLSASAGAGAGASAGAGVGCHAP